MDSTVVSAVESREEHTSAAVEVGLCEKYTVLKIYKLAVSELSNRRKNARKNCIWSRVRFLFLVDCCTDI